eukprot:gene5852-5763_t
MASLSSQTKEQQEAHKKYLGKLLDLEGNKECMDCQSRVGVTWASTNLGIFVCMRCS